MTDYNDGKIHGWNGGDCPVHPETVVKSWLAGAATLNYGAPAKELNWRHGGEPWDIIAFQVVKEYVELKVIWVNEYPRGIHTSYSTEEAALAAAGPTAIRIAVKYVEVKDD